MKDLFVCQTPAPPNHMRVLARWFLHRLVKDGSWNRSFLGGAPAPDITQRPPGRLQRLLPADVLPQMYEFETNAIVTRYLQNAPVSSARVELPAELQPALGLELGEIEGLAGLVQLTAPAWPGPPSFSIVVPFFRHLEAFRQCIASVARLDSRIPFELIVVNDDRAISSTSITAVLPRALATRSRVLSNPENVGIVPTLNRGIRASALQWILFLDCDDELTPDCLNVLSSHIESNPRVRYITSGMVDIDESGAVLRYRRRNLPPTKLATSGMIAGHLKAVRRDLFDEIGLLEDAFTGCQDFEFALRTSLYEPILAISDYLYRYRWHPQTQSVARANYQTATADLILALYRTVVWLAKTGDQHLPVATRFFNPRQFSLSELVARVRSRQQQ